MRLLLTWHLPIVGVTPLPIPILVLGDTRYDRSKTAQPWPSIDSLGRSGAAITTEEAVNQGVIDRDG